jgi:hypothetical protein
VNLGWRWWAVAAAGVVNPTVRRALNVAMHRESLEVQLRALAPDRVDELNELAAERQRQAIVAAINGLHGTTLYAGLESVVRDVAAGEL